MMLAGYNRCVRRKTWPSVTLSTTNPEWSGMGSNPGLRIERLTTNDLSQSINITQGQVLTQSRLTCSDNIKIDLANSGCVTVPSGFG